VTGAATRRTKTAARAGHRKLAASGKLRIGDDWNAITIIALSQDNPSRRLPSSSKTASTPGRATSSSPARANAENNFSW
jgi:hypothetical protein